MSAAPGRADPSSATARVPAAAAPAAGAAEAAAAVDAAGTASAAGATAPTSAAASPAADFSLAVLGELIALGVTDAVLTPGSRSQALALTLAELHRARMLELQVRIDERVAGFTALGLAAETGLPAIVVTTSGTAVANLLPAVLEAHHSRVPMLLLTSDRPASMRGTAGNQTTWQPGIFGRFVRLALDVPAPTGDAGEGAVAAQLAADAVDAALGTHTGNPGPVHLNLQLREPLSAAVPDLMALVAAGEWMPGAAGRAEATSTAAAATSTAAASVVATSTAAACTAAASAVAVDPVLSVSEGAGILSALALEQGPRTVVIAGHDAGPAAEELAHRAGWPLIAEPSSGSRFGRNLIVAYRELLGDPDFGGRVERAIVFGHPTLSREVPALSLREDVETIVVTPAAASVPVGEVVVDAYNPGRRVALFVTAVEVAGVAESGARSSRWASVAAPAPVAAADANGAAAERDWLRSWVLASRAILDEQGADDPIPAPNIELANSPDIAERRAYRLAETAALKAPVTRRTLALAVWQATWPHDRLVLGASRLIRDLDRAVPGKKIRVHANRGLAGIDGTVSTATGIALASQRPPLPPLASLLASESRLGVEEDVMAAASPTAPARASSSAARDAAGAGATQHGVTRVLLGDLTLLHDAGALLFGTGEARPRIQLIVANDGGGTIFDTLEVAATADRAAFDRVMLTPQTVDLEALAKAYGWAYSRVATRTELDRALTAPLAGPTLLEVPLAR